MKPDILGDHHPLEYAVVDGLGPRDLLKAPVVLGTAEATDAEVFAWLKSNEVPSSLMSAGLRTARHFGGTVKYAVIRFTWCPECSEWSPCRVRRERGY